MTLFGIDISNYQDNIDLAAVKAQGFTFCAAKATQAADYRSADYPRQRDQAKAIGLRFCAYHFLRPSSVASMAGQVANLKGHIGDLSIPVMLDVESYNGSTPSASEVSLFVTLARAAGLKMRWLYWQGDHPLLPGMLKWHAAYGTNPAGYASVIYPGDGDSHWNTTVPTTIWQYGSRGKVDGWSGDVDVNAFRGTLADLDALHGFTQPAQPEPIPEADMALTDADVAKVWAYGIENRNDPEVATGKKAPASWFLTNLESTQDLLVATIGGLKGSLDVLSAALAAHAPGGELDVPELIAAVRQASEDGTKAAILGNTLDVNVSVHDKETP